MALFKIKKTERTAVSLVPAWHPNFRNFDRLPDVKVVRTSFFVNCVAVVITLVVLFYFGLQEYKLHEVRLQIADWQRQIDANQKPSEKAVGTYHKFQAQESKVAEVVAYVKSDFVRSDFIIELGQSLPDNIVLDSININESGVSLHGIVQGTFTVATGQAEAYLDQLRADPRLSAKFEATMPGGLNQDSKADQMNFNIVLKAKNGK
jgi:hypothetical protein